MKQHLHAQGFNTQFGGAYMDRILECGCYGSVTCILSFGQKRKEAQDYPTV